MSRLIKWIFEALLTSFFCSVTACSRRAMVRLLSFPPQLALPLARR